MFKIWISILITIFSTITYTSLHANDLVTPHNDEPESLIYIPFIITGYADYIGTTYQMPPRSQNSLLMRANRSGGYTIDYFGNRSEEGIPTEIEYVTVKKPNEDSPVLITIEDDKPQLIVSEDGHKFEITWITETDIRITTTTPDGRYQTSVPINLEDPQLITRKQSNSSAVISKREHCPAGEPKGTIEQITRNISTNFFVPNAPVVINVNKCEQPYDSETPVRIRYQSDEFGTTDYVAQQISTGVYQANIPVYIPNNDTPIGDFCIDVVGILGHGCSALSGIPAAQITAICVYIGAGFDTILGGPTGEGFAVTAACQSGFGAATTYCNTIGGGPAPGAPSLADIICEEMRQFELPDSTIDLTPYVFDPTAERWLYGNRQSFPTSGPFSTLELNLSGETTVEQFYTSPEDPNPQQGYRAFAQISPCNVTNPVQVTISILGTDEYSNSITYTITEPSLLSLGIPGAQEGVRDVITVSIDGSDVRTISIVF